MVEKEEENQTRILERERNAPGGHFAHSLRSSRKRSGARGDCGITDAKRQNIGILTSARLVPIVIAPFLFLNSVVFNGAPDNGTRSWGTAQWFGYTKVAQTRPAGVETRAYENERNTVR